MKCRVFVLVCCFMTSAVAARVAFCDVRIRHDVSDGVYIGPLTDNTILENYGIIDSDIYANDNLLDVYNYGTINGIIHTDIGFINQYVDSVDALHKVTVDNGVDLYIVIDGVDNINLTDMINMGDAANFNITHSSIVINDFADWQNWNQIVNLDATDTLIISDSSTIVSNTVINHVNARVPIQTPDLDSNFRVELSNNSGSWVINIVNNENNVGSSNDPAINALNNARSGSAINRIKRLSYHFNPSVLMNPIKTINKFTMSNILEYKSSLYSGLSGFYLVADKTDAYGFDLNFKGKYNNVYLSANFNFHDFNYRDDYNDFDGLMYGFNIGAKTDFDNFWLDGVAGLSLIDFDADNISHKGKNKYDPMGVAGYAKIDVGHNYDILPDLIVSPFIGASVATYKLYDIYDTDYNLRGGGKVKYSFVTDNIRYEYSGAGTISVNGDLYGAVKVGFISEIDGAGVSLGFDVLKTKEETGYKISVNGNITF